MVDFISLISRVHYDVMCACAASYDVANQKANKAMDTSDLSTTEAHSDVERASSVKSRTRHSPMRYSPPPLQENRERSNHATSASQTPVASPQTPVTIPGGLLRRSSVLMGHNNNSATDVRESPAAVPCCSHWSEPSTSVQPDHSSSGGKLILV